MLHSLFVLGRSRAHPKNKFWPQEPEDIIEEGDGEQEDGEEPSLPDDKLENVHALKTKYDNFF